MFSKIFNEVHLNGHERKNCIKICLMLRFMLITDLFQEFNNYHNGYTSLA